MWWDLKFLLPPEDRGDTALVFGIFMRWNYPPISTLAPVSSPEYIPVYRVSEEEECGNKGPLGEFDVSRGGSLGCRVLPLVVSSYTPDWPIPNSPVSLQRLSTHVLRNGMGIRMWPPVWIRQGEPIIKQPLCRRGHAAIWFWYTFRRSSH